MKQYKKHITNQNEKIQRQAYLHWSHLCIRISILLLIHSSNKYLLRLYNILDVALNSKIKQQSKLPTLIPTSGAEEAEVEWFNKDLQDLLELTPKKDALFIIGDWNAKVGSQEIPEVTGKFGLVLTEFCQENALVIANTLFQQHKRRLYTWTSPDGQHQFKLIYSLQPKME